MWMSYAPLNEGGGFHPRNPAQDGDRTAGSAPLNEGGGFHPRNPRRAGAGGADVPATLNEGGGFHPRNPSPSRPPDCRPT